MNHKLISGLTATLLLSAAIGATNGSNAESTSAASQDSEAEHSKAKASHSPSTKAQVSNVVKVGEQQTRSQSKEESIAKIQPHERSGRKAATLYVRNIPVLTFVGSKRTASDKVKIGEVQTDAQKIATLNPRPGNAPAGNASEQRQNSDHSSGDPIARATAIAARLNQLYRDGVDAKNITVSWKPTKGNSSVSSETGRYVIEANKTAIVAVDSQTVLPDTTNNPDKDALQVTNRLRRLIGNADPIKKIRNKPDPNSQQISLGPIRLRTDGMASWYGPGFDGNLSASGEVFNQEALTAAHKSLPFGTRVQVTNLDNGKSVVVRINDRGPYSGGRVIDLSAAAARVIGLVQSGVAPVRLEVFSRQAAN